MANPMTDEKRAEYVDACLQLIVKYRKARARYDMEREDGGDDAAKFDISDIPRQQPDYLRVAKLEFRELGWKIYVAHGLAGMVEVAEEVGEIDPRHLSACDSYWDGIGAMPSLAIAGSRNITIDVR